MMSLQFYHNANKKATVFLGGDLRCQQQIFMAVK